MSVPFTLVDPLAAASAVFLEQEYQRNSLGGLIIPQRILLLGQYNAGKTPTDNVPQLLLSEGDAATATGWGPCCTSCTGPWPPARAGCRSTLARSRLRAGLRLPPGPSFPRWER